MLRSPARAGLLAAALTLSLASPAAAAIQAGAGKFPGLAVDAAGTGYVAWIDGPASAQTLRFCRIPRAASGCDTTTTIGPINGDVVTPVRVSVSGSRIVVAHSDRVSGDQLAQFAWTSTDGGASFGPRRAIGSLLIHDATDGPGDALSTVQAGNAGVRFQRMPIDGSAPVNPDGSSALGAAVLSPETRAYEPTVGLLDPATPVVVWERFRDGYEGAAFSRYDGSGDPNSAANWTAPVEIGPIFNVHLAGGPKGLFLLGSERSSPFDPGSTIARRFDGSSFGAPVTVGGPAVSGDLTQDAGGRLHAVYTNGRDASTIDLNHAVSDDGATWRTGILETFPASTTGALVHPSVRVAPDHVGLVAAATATDPGGIGVARLGPDAPGPLAPPPAPAPPALTPPPASTRPLPTKIASSSSVVLRGKSFAWKLSGTVDATTPASRRIGCGGTVRATLLRGRIRAATALMKVASKGFCSFRLEKRIAKRSVRGVRKLKLRLRFSGTADLAPVTRTTTIHVRR